MLTGEDLRRTSAEALPQLVAGIDVFAEIEPLQKEQILRALRESGAVVGFLGDGINDASALHAADVGISVDGAVDVAKEAADIVLLRHDLSVLARGVRLGRETFANTLKYIFITTSANFGNMLSMAGASLFLPFLPLARPLGLVPLPVRFVLLLLGITAAYLLASEAAKHAFYRHAAGRERGSGDGPPARRRRSRLARPRSAVAEAAPAQGSGFTSDAE